MKYKTFNPTYSAEGEVVEINGEFRTVELEVLKDSKLAIETLIDLLFEKQSEMLNRISSVYEVRAALDKLKNDIARNRELLKHLKKL